MIKKLVDIGTKKLEVSVHGAGMPTVVIETGMDVHGMIGVKLLVKLARKQRF